MKASHRDLAFIGLGIVIVGLLVVLVMRAPDPILWPVPPPPPPPTTINVTVEQPKVCDQGGMLQRMCEAGATK